MLRGLVQGYFQFRAHRKVLKGIGVLASELGMPRVVLENRLSEWLRDDFESYQSFSQLWEREHWNDFEVAAHLISLGFCDAELNNVTDSERQAFRQRVCWWRSMALVSERLCEAAVERVDT